MPAYLEGANQADRQRNITERHTHTHRKNGSHGQHQQLMEEYSFGQRETLNREDGSTKFVVT